MVGGTNNNKLKILVINYINKFFTPVIDIAILPSIFQRGSLNCEVFGIKQSDDIFMFNTEC